MLVDEFLHIFIGPSIHGSFQSDAVLGCKILDQVVRAETLVTLAAIHQRIRKAAQVSGCHPCLGVHQNRTVNAHVVGVLLDELFPPSALDIVLELNAEITVIPGVGKPAVNLGARIDEASGLCKSFDFVHCFFHVMFLTFFCHRSVANLVRTLEADSTYDTIIP